MKWYHYKEKHPIFRKLCIPILCLMLFQSAIFYITTVHGGVVDTMKQNANDILNERVTNRKNDMQTQWNTKWTNFAPSVESISEIYHEVKNNSTEAVYSDKELQKRILSESVDTLIRMLRTNSVNGVFLILNDEKEYHPIQENQEQKKYGICIRDYDANSSYTHREDLLTVRCPASLTSELGCSLETWWEAMYTFDSQQKGDFYFKPLQAAYENPDASIYDLAYFSRDYQISENASPVVAYSLPLLDEEGYPYGVLGIEITSSYLESLLPSEELYGYNEGSYALVRYEEGDNQLYVIATDGVLFQRCFGNQQDIELDGISEQGVVDVFAKNELDICITWSDIRIYNKNTPFEGEKMALIGMVERDALYAVGNNVRKILLLVSGLVLLIGVIGIFVVCQWMTKPIKRLAEKVRSMDGKNEVRLERIQIDEIDELVNAVEDMSQKIAKNRVRTEFFSRMSHDMRTPLNAILGFSSGEILEEATEEQKDEYLSKIQTSGTYLLGLINEVLDMTKIDSEQMEIKEAPISVLCFREDILPMVQELAKQKGIHLKFEMPKQETYIMADRQRLNQIFVNLLSNALKFTPEGGTVLFSVEEAEKTEEFVTNKIVIKDSGIGMSKDFQEKLYQPFSQEHAGLVEGTGLGLSITSQLIEMMHGTIECESEPGKGTTFTVMLKHPLVKKEKVKKRRDSLTGIEFPKKLSGRRVLICEDHPLNLQIARNLLEKEGMLVEEAQNGKIGVEKFANAPIGYYEVILMDIRMPEMDGMEAARAIRRMEREDAGRVPIIAMTANAFVEDQKETEKAGMNAHLSKPISPARLYQTLAEFFD